MKKTHCIEGVILRTTPYRDHDLILTVFSAEEGMISLIARGYANPKKAKGSITTPMTQAEFIYSESRGELQRCQEVSVINTHLRLRRTLPAIETSCRMLHALLVSQFPNKPAPELYTLFIRYIEKTPNFPNPETLAISFILKILRYEGLIDMETPPGNVFFWKALALARSFEELEKIEYPQGTWDNVYHFFREQIK